MNHKQWLREAGRVAQDATCRRARCGAVIIKDEEVIGRGFNSPPADDEEQRRCGVSKAEYDLKVTDKTCCIHAEQRAVMDALRRNPDKIRESTLYFMRIEDSGELTKAGQPYCTICSKMALDAGIQSFVLWHEDGVTVYPTREYNKLSFKYES